MGIALKYGTISIGPALLAPTCARISFCFSMMYLVDTDALVKRWPLWACIGSQAVLNCAAVILYVSVNDLPVFHISLTDVSQYTQCGDNLSIIWSTHHFFDFFNVCIDPIAQRDYNYFLGSFNTATDAFLAILPAILIKHTTMSMKDKFGVGCLMCLSSVYVAA